ncbi:MAG TPA: choice-of-anchor D domain-containing protein [Promineifilum sp.]|nr:choice-of-anchor D domain-containing protein [Promineifilum sp.]
MKSIFRVWRLGVLVLTFLGFGAMSVAARADEIPVPSLWYSPLEIHFGSVPIDGRVERQVDVHNLGTAPMTLSGGEVEKPFSIDYDTCGGVVAAGASCRLTFSFAPTAAGDFTAEANGDSDAGPWHVVLRGRTAAPEITVSPRSLDFGRGLVGSAFPPQVVVVTNIGGVPVGGFRAEPVSVPFTGGLGQCAAGLQPGQSCHMTFDFAAENAGVFHKFWTAQSDAGPIEIELQGRTYTGIAGTGQGVTPRAIDFGPVRVGDTIRQTVTFHNFDPSIPIVNWDYSWITDDPYIDFDYQTNCGESLPGLAECKVTISYRPRDFGDDTVILNVLNSQGIIDINLWGQGAAAEIVADSPAIDLGMATDGRGSDQVVRFTNLGHGPADVLGIESAPSFIISDSDCGDVLAPGQSCRAWVRFDPNGYGRREEEIALLTGADPVPVRVVGGLLTPQLAVAFAPRAATVGDLVHLRLTFSNANPAQALFDLGLDGQLPGGLALLDGPPEASANCGGPTLTRAANGTEFSLRDMTLAAGDTCIVDLAAQAVLAGQWRFDSAAYSHAGPSQLSGDSLVVTDDEETFTYQLFLPSLLGPTN